MNEKGEFGLFIIGVLCGLVLSWLFLGVLSIVLVSSDDFQNFSNDIINVTQVSCTDSINDTYLFQLRSCEISLAENKVYLDWCQSDLMMCNNK